MSDILHGPHDRHLPEGLFWVVRAVCLILEMLYQ